MILFFFIIIFITIVDQIIKFFIEANLFNRSVEIIDNIFSLTYLQNYGAAWGIFSDNNWLLEIITPILIICILFYFYKNKSDKFAVMTGSFIVGGAIGNYIDRLVRGYVVDYIDFKIWPVFNFADICIVLGCILFCINLFIKEKKYGD